MMKSTIIQPTMEFFMMEDYADDFRSNQFICNDNEKLDSSLLYTDKEQTEVVNILRNSRSEPIPIKSISENDIKRKQRINSEKYDISRKNTPIKVSTPIQCSPQSCPSSWKVEELQCKIQETEQKVKNQNTKIEHQVEKQLKEKDQQLQIMERQIETLQNKHLQLLDEIENLKSNFRSLGDELANYKSNHSKTVQELNRDIRVGKPVRFVPLWHDTSRYMNRIPGSFINEEKIPNDIN